MYPSETWFLFCFFPLYDVCEDIHVDTSRYNLLIFTIIQDSVTWLCHKLFTHSPWGI